MWRWVVGLALITIAPSTPTAPLSGPERVPAFSVAAGDRWGMASWYGGGEPLHDHVAMGHRFDPESLEAAMWDVPFGALMKVTNLENGRSVVVRITDRGPSRRFRNRVIDLTRGSFARIASLRQGLVPVHVERMS